MLACGTTTLRTNSRRKQYQNMLIKSDGTTYPPFFNEDFFTTSLELGLDEQVILIQEVKFEMGSSPGDNYCSKIFRVHVTFKKKRSDKVFNASLIVKSLLDGPEMDFLEFSDCFSKERTAYMKILPLMEFLVDGVKLAPKCFYTQKNPIRTYVFEDLCSLGYKLGEREAGLDLSHCKIAMKKIAQFHGASMILARKSNGIFNKFTRGIISEEVLFRCPSFHGLFGGHLRKLASVSEKWSGFKDIARKLENYYEHFNENLLKCSSRRFGEVAVLNHGDFWANNIMFKYNQDGEPGDCVFVDMQYNVYTSPGIDLNYFFNTTVQLDILVNKREDLIQLYYRSLKETLEYQHYEEVPSYERIRNEVAEREAYGLFSLFGVLPTAIADKSQSKDLSLESLVDEDLGQQQRDALFSLDKLQDHMKYSLKRFDDLGVL